MEGQLRISLITKLYTNVMFTCGICDEYKSLEYLVMDVDGNKAIISGATRLVEVYKK